MYKYFTNKKNYYYIIQNIKLYIYKNKTKNITNAILHV